MQIFTRCLRNSRSKYDTLSLHVAGNSEILHCACENLCNIPFCLRLVLEDREILTNYLQHCPFSVMLFSGYHMMMLNNIPKPNICPRCSKGPTCSEPVINTCVCNPCENFDDQCTPNPDPTQPRTCEGTPDTTGNPFTLMFMQNRPDNTDKRELVRTLTLTARSKLTAL